MVLCCMKLDIGCVGSRAIRQSLSFRSRSTTVFTLSRSTSYELQSDLQMANTFAGFRSAS